MSRNLLGRSFLVVVACALVYSGAVACPASSKCLFVVGNSITFHGPSEEVHWTGSWGMAASREELDFVSQLSILLAGGADHDRWLIHRESGKSLEQSASPGTFDIAPWVEGARGSQVIVVELGDNVASDSSTVAEFGVAYDRLVAALAQPRSAVVCLGTWWRSKQRDQLIANACRQHGGVFVSLDGLFNDPSNQARSERKIEDRGVGVHPGDQGMRRIADRIYRGLLQANSIQQQ